MNWRTLCILGALAMAAMLAASFFLVASWGVKSPGPNAGPNARPKTVAREFLYPNDPEPPGYGLYTYVLFGARASNEVEKMRQLEVIQVYLRQDLIDQMRELFEPRELNLFCMPLTRDTDEDPVEILAIYDFARAKRLLSQVQAGVSPGRSLDEGPYLVGVSRPLGGAQMAEPPILFVNLSDSDPRLVVPWMSVFLRQSNQERFWEVSVRDTWLLQVREGLADAARGVDGVVPSLGDLKRVVTWVWP